MISNNECVPDDSEKSLIALGESLRKMARRTSTPTVQRSWNSKLRLSILRKMSPEIPEDTIIECLADTIKYDVTIPDDVLFCKFRQGADFPFCRIARIEQDTKIYLKLNGINIDQYPSLLGAAIFLLLERQAEGQLIKSQEQNRGKKVVVEYVESINSVSISVCNKACNPRSLLKTNQSIVLRTLKPGQVFNHRNR
ncbi:hypothetical protein O3M35_000343 [Rhynocoris fuscipes]|uniref:Uncharacterized protein n=1 Tax=Rhynocoris fuscipes TaxID=488301 RepID=A0AAW1DSK1_9HEMI